MARYTGPRVPHQPSFRHPDFWPHEIFGAQELRSRRSWAPSPAASTPITVLGLIEKQKLRYYYGLMERQFRGVYERALKRRGVTGETDVADFGDPPWTNVAFHLGFGNTRAAARQLIGHGHVKVNGRKVNIPSFRAQSERRGGNQGLPAFHARSPPRTWKWPPAAFRP